jgi:DNA polymerase II small subunit
MVVSVNVIIKEALENGFQVEPKAFELIKSLEDKDIDVIKIMQEVINRKISSRIKKNITKEDIDSLLPSFVKEISAIDKEQLEKLESKVEIIKNIGDKVNLFEGKEGFESLFKSRYNKLLRIISSRPDHYRIEKVSSIKENRKEGKRRVTGLVMSKKIRRSNVVLTLDDNTGVLEALAVDKKIIDEAKQVLLDSLVMIDIVISKGGAFIIKSISLPDIPDHTPIVSSKKVYAVFTSDLHVGSKNFLNKAFQSFLLWLGDNEDSDVVRRIKYLIIAGDAIDGIGVYPGQMNDLNEPDVKMQYTSLTKMLRQIPNSIEIFIIPGNHDPVRQALPQSAIPRIYAEELYNIDNVTMLGNPSYLRLHDVNILIYHGRSLDDVMATTPGFTFTRPAVAMKLLLRSRHLVPVYGERTAVVPATEDSLVIEDVPDIFHSGHIHTLDSENYRGTLILNSGCWQSQTPFQAKMGIVPTPGIVPIVDLSSLEVFTKDFRYI